MMFLLGVYLKRLTAPPLIKVTLSLNLVWQSLMHCGMPSEDRVTSKSNYFLDGYKKKKKNTSLWKQTVWTPRPSADPLIPLREDNGTDGQQHQNS